MGGLCRLFQDDESRFVSKLLFSLHCNTACTRNKFSTLFLTHVRHPPASQAKSSHLQNETWQTSLIPHFSPNLIRLLTHSSYLTHSQNVLLLSYQTTSNSSCAQYMIHTCISAVFLSISLVDPQYEFLAGEADREVDLL